MDVDVLEKDDDAGSVGSAGSEVYEYDDNGIDEEDPFADNFQQQLIADIEKRVKEVRGRL